MSELKPCPCGKTPTDLHIQDVGQGGKWAYCTGNCCDEWSVEFRTGYYPMDSAECMELAATAWNESPRALPSPPTGD